MYVVVRNPLYRIIAAGCSIAVILVVYLAIVKPSNDTANHALSVGEQQAQQAVQQVNKATGGAVPKSVSSLTSCLAAAGTDTGKVQACNAKFHPNLPSASAAVAAGEKQAQQAVAQANKASGGAVPQSVSNLTSCLAAAGTDTGKIQACDTKFKP